MRRRAISVLLPCPRATSEPWASRITTELGTSPKPRVSPTALTTRRCAPFLRALTAPWKSTSPAIRGGLRLLLDLRSRHGERPVVGNSCGHDDGVGVASGLAHRVEHVMRGSRSDDGNARWQDIE